MIRNDCRPIQLDLAIPMALAQEFLTEEDDLISDLLPSMLLSPTIALNRDQKFQPQYEPVAVHPQGTCPRECGHTHLTKSSKVSLVEQQNTLIMQNRYAFIVPKRCYKKDEGSDKNDYRVHKFRPFCFANGCNERGPISFVDDRFAVFEWRLQHDCEANFAGSLYVKQPLPQLHPEHLVHNAKVDQAKGTDPATKAKLLHATFADSPALAARHARKRKHQGFTHPHNVTMEQPHSQQVSKKAPPPTPLTPDPTPQGGKRKLMPKVPEFSALPSPENPLPPTSDSDDGSQLSTDDFIACAEQKLKELSTGLSTTK